MQLEDPLFVDKANELVKFYRQYPEIAAEELLRVQLSDIQKVILRAMWEKRYVMAVVSRGGGKTFLDAVIACLKALLYPGYRVGLIAPTFRQSKMIFEECTKLWQRSPVFQSATEKKPTQQSDNCYIRFRSAGGKPGSIIQAIPLGDGNKIRGSRFFTIICDEFPHIPEEIFNMVIRPMGATVSDPMENVERIKRQKALLAAGLISSDELEEGQTNQILITSSGYFTFNHMYKLYLNYREQMLEGDKDYAVFRVPYTLIPEGFLDEKNIESSKREMSSLEFRMEYEAEFIPDTDGFYKASLLESCKSKAFTVQLEGQPEKSYLLAIDPARTEDAFAVSVVEIGRPAKLVNALELHRRSFPEMARYIETLCQRYNVSLIYMDSQGGGLSLKDILAENLQGLPEGPILDCEDPMHQMKSGRHILKLCNFSTDFISQSNFSALRLLENREFLFPDVPKDEGNDRQAEAWSTINAMKSQIQMIVVSETTTGKLHFDVPKGGGHGKQKKDLYTSFMLAARGIYDLLWAEEMPVDILQQVGVVIPRQVGSPMPGGFAQGYDYGADLPDILKDKLAISENPEKYKADLIRSMATKRTVLTSPAAVLKPKPKPKRGN